MSTPVKASFASAVQAGSINNPNPNPNNSNSNNAQATSNSPVVKLPTAKTNVSTGNASDNAQSTTTTTTNATQASASKPLITIDSDSPATVKVNSVKFGSFAAAASGVSANASTGASTVASNASNGQSTAPVTTANNIGQVPVAPYPQVQHAQQQQQPQQVHYQQAHSYHHQHQQQPRYNNYQQQQPQQYQSRPSYYPPGGHYQQPRPANGYTPRPRPPYYDQARPQFVPVPVVPVGPVPVVPVAPVAPVVIKPAAAPLKLKLVDPVTGKEIQLGGKPVVGEAAEAKVEVKPVEAKVEAKPVETKAEAKPVEVKPEAKPVPVQSAPVQIQSAPVQTQPAQSAPVQIQPVQKPVQSTPIQVQAQAPPPLLSLKKLGITIKDPSSNTELDISQVLQRKATSVDDLTSAMAGLNTNVDEKKELLAGLRVEDDDVSDGEDDEDYSDESDYDETGDEEDEDEFLPSTVQYGKAITYPPQFIPYLPPADESGVWRYSRAFLLQFQPVCTTTPTDLHERLSAAVERAKAYARSTDRHGGRRRDGRRAGSERDPHRKRRSNNGLLGPQAHLLDPNAVLKNRADNAWAPVKSVEELSAMERVLREVKGLLNKLTIEKFTVISDKILALEIMSSDVLSGVIDCVFDKAVEEPRFAPMYAELCYKIVVFEMNAAKGKAAGEAKDSQFRKFLVERCQAEYKHKRAWSKQRLEKLTGEVVESSEAAGAEKTEKVVGELTDEDYLMIKLKRRVLGNMRFIGEIFKVGLIGEKIMHSIITELLSNVENPEEEEIECLCRLLMTVGNILDKPEAANFWSQYIARLQWLIAQTGKLSSRIRFMLMDVVEAREKGWRGVGRDEGPKSIAQIEKESKEREARDREQRERDRRGPRDSRDARDSRGGDAREQQQHRDGPVRQFTTKKSAADDWNRTGSGSNRPSRQSSVRIAERPISPITTASTSSVPVNRYESLLMEEDSTSSLVSKSSPAPSPSPSVDDSAQVKKIVSLWAEFVQMNNVNDLCEEFGKLASPQGKVDAVAGLVNKAVDAGKKAAIMQLLSFLGSARDKALLSEDDLLGAFEASFGMIDDLAVDIPAVFELAGALMAGVGIGFEGVMKCLAGCSDAQAKGRVCLYAAKESSVPEYREKMLGDVKSLVDGHQSLISLQERLMK